MDYRLEFIFDDKGLGVNRVLNIKCSKVDDICKTIISGDEDLYNQIYDEFQDIIGEAVSSYHIVADCEITKDKAGNLVYSAAYNYIDEMIKNAQICINNEENIVFQHNYKEETLRALKKCLYEIIDDRKSCEQCDIDETAAMLACVKEFISKGTWHFGLQKDDSTVITDVKQWPRPIIKGQNISWIKDDKVLKPVLWFGPEGVLPIEYWSIYCTERNLKKYYSAAHIRQAEISISGGNEKECNKDCSIWFPLSNTENVFGATDIDWYSYYWISECGMDEPIIDDKIIEQCPINLSYEETVDSMLNKTNRFFIEKYNNAF